MGANHPHYVRVRDALRNLEAGADPRRVEVELHVRGRAHSYVLKPGKLIQEDKPNGTLVILQDVIYLRDQDRARTNLLGTLSHELRTPLTSMMIATQTLARQKESLSASQRKLVELTVEETGRMNQLADNLMNLARGNIPSIPTERVRIELGKLVTETSRRFAVQAQAKHIALKTQVDGTPVVSADRIKLSWVISNLIGNALPYTPEGGTIEVAAREGKNNLLRLQVADTGPGIPPEIRDHVFERYTQFSTPGYEPGSAGLGLAIVKDIVEAHGGRITIESNNGIGTRFIVQRAAFQEV